MSFRGKALSGSLGKRVDGGFVASTIDAESTIVLARRSRAWVTTLAAYVALTKPRIIELLLVTTLPVMMLAAHGVPSFALAGYTLVGGTLRPARPTS